MVALPNGTTSAFVGQPPNTERDYYIVRGFLRGAGLFNVDPALGYTPAAQPPSPDYTYASRRPGIIVGLIIIIVAITSATVTRLVLRASMSQMRFGPDDWATMAAGSFGLTYTVCQLIMALKGGGNHIWDATYEDYYTFNYYGVLDKWFFYVTVGFVKLSLAFFIRRLADRTSWWWRLFCNFFIVTIVVYIGLAVCWEILSCTPARAQWDRLYAGQLDEPMKCYLMGVQGKFFNYTHVFQGVTLLLSPMVILWSVKMERAKKIRLFVIWGTGTIAVLCGLMRVVRADYTADIMWDYTELLVWTSLDVCIGIITISLPVMDAWLANAWKGAVTRLGIRSENHGTGYSRHYSHGTAVRTGSNSTSKNKSSSESVQEIMSPDAHEMRIFIPTDNAIPYKWVVVANPDGSLAERQRTADVLRRLDRSKYTLAMVAPPVEPREEGQDEEGLGAEDAGYQGAQQLKELAPVCRIIDKHAHAKAEEDKEKEWRRKQKNIKELEINWAIDSHDLKHRLDRFLEFLEKGKRVEVTLARKRKSRPATPQEASALVDRFSECAAVVPAQCVTKVGQFPKLMTMAFEQTKAERQQMEQRPGSAKERYEALLESQKAGDE